MTSNDPLPLGHPDALRRLLASRGVPAAADGESLLRAACAPEHKLGVTLLSAWEAAGRALSADHRRELAASRHRIHRYQDVWPLIRGAAPGAYLVKGATIGVHYPPGLLRAAGDLDVVCPAAQLWPAARALLDAGWEFFAFTIFPGRPSLTAANGGQAGRPAGSHLLIELRQPPDTMIEEPYAVELRTADVATSIRMPAQQLAGGAAHPVAANILALAAERWERPFRSRDVYDLAVLSGLLDAAERASLRASLTETGLWPEALELAGLLRRSGLRPDARLPGGLAAAWRARVARALRAAARMSHPVRALGYLSLTTVDDDRGPLADRLARMLHERIGGGRLLRLGVPLFAVPLPVVTLPVVRLPAGPAGPEPGASPEPAPATMRLVRRGRHLVALTPIGAFLMVAGSCQEDWLTEAAGGPREAAPDATAGRPHRSAGG